jgi:hypothetical protein
MQHSTLIGCHCNQLYNTPHCATVVKTVSRALDTTLALAAAAAAAVTVTLDFMTEITCKTAVVVVSTWCCMNRGKLCSIAALHLVSLAVTWSSASRSSSLSAYTASIWSSQHSNYSGTAVAGGAWQYHQSPAKIVMKAAMQRLSLRQQCTALKLCPKSTANCTQ